MKDPNKVLLGKQSRRRGIKFEHDTHTYLTSIGYHVTRWNNIINTQTTPHTLQQAKGNKFHTSTGFPDFLAFKPHPTHPHLYTVILIECKTNNTLTKQEKLQLNHYQYTLHIPSYIAYPHPTNNTPTLRQHTQYTPKVHNNTLLHNNTPISTLNSTPLPRLTPQKPKK